MSKCTFRAAVPGDEALILKFIHELAVYEKMDDQVVATPELLTEWIFAIRNCLHQARIVPATGC